MKQHRLPLWVKLLYTAFVAVLVPQYLWSYGPTNFLYFCDVALLLTLIGIWSEVSLPISASAVGILLPQSLWILDFLGSAIGHPIIGMTSYMFLSSIPLFTRALSFFHFWLPLFLLWLLWRLGYDRRAFLVWTAGAWTLMFVCYALLPPPPAPASNPTLPVNVNYVFGLSDEHPQTLMHPLLYLGLMGAFLPLLLFWPTHRLLLRLFPASQQGLRRP